MTIFFEICMYYGKQIERIEYNFNQAFTCTQWLCYNIISRKSITKIATCAYKHHVEATQKCKKKPKTMASKTKENKSTS